MGYDFKSAEDTVWSVLFHYLKRLKLKKFTSIKYSVLDLLLYIFFTAYIAAVVVVVF